MNPVARPLLITTVLLAALRPAAGQDAPVTSMGPLQQPVYKCGTARYTQVPCAGGEQLGAPRVSRTFDRHAAPPQDRARQMARAQLPPETREKCAALETQIREGEARLRAKGEPPTEAEEGDLAIHRVHYREMRC